MKKIILFIAVISAFSFASCKKDHVCTCTVASTLNGVALGSSTDVTTYTKSKKGDAMSHCLNRTETSGNYVATYSCSLN
jgi:hypothetical protein